MKKIGLHICKYCGAEVIEDDSLCYKRPIKLNIVDQIKDWLEEDNGKWKQSEENNRVFTDFRYGRYIAIYSDHVKYIDDLRMASAIREYPLPKNKHALFCIINTPPQTDK